MVNEGRVRIHSDTCIQKLFCELEEIVTHTYIIRSGLLQRAQSESGRLKHAQLAMLV